MRLLLARRWAPSSGSMVPSRMAGSTGPLIELGQCLVVNVAFERDRLAAIQGA